MSPQYYNEQFHKSGAHELNCDYFNLPQFTHGVTDQLILKITSMLNSSSEFLIINRGNTFPHLHIKNIKLK